MALTRAKKTQKVDALAKELAGSTSAIVGTFAKLTVSQDFDLRQKVRAAGGSYRVLKNKLAARASVGTGIEGALQGLKGVSSVAYTSGDPVALAKALTSWVKDNSQFSFKLGIIDGKLITVDEVQALSTMPGKEELYAKLLFLISSPAQRLVTVINAAGRDLAVVIGQGVEQGKFAEGAVAASASQPSAAVAAAAAGEEAPSPAAVADEPVVEAPITEVATPTAADAQVDGQAGDPAAESGATNAADAIEVAPDAAPTETESAVDESAPTQSVAADPIAEVSEAPAPAEGPAAEGAEAESQPKQAEEAAGEAPAEG